MKINSEITGMSIYALVLLFALVFTACGTVPEGNTHDTGKGYNVKVIDGCQYIEVVYGPGLNNGYYSLAHKGDCRNPIHCRAK